VIVLTGHGTEDDRKKCLELGAYDFIHKPIGIDKLMAILEKIEREPA
jgi:DNA-binding response OmpR family regulator